MDSSHREGKSRTIERGISQEDLSEESQSDVSLRVIESLFLCVLCYKIVRLICSKTSL